MISVSDELKTMIDEYNKIHKFRKLHISEICQEAIYNAITGGDFCNVPVSHEMKVEPVAENKQIAKNSSDKPVLSCPICNKEFIQTIPTRKYCSKNCATTASRRRNKASI